MTSLSCGNSYHLYNRDREIDVMSQSSIVFYQEQGAIKIE